MQDTLCGQFARKKTMIRNQLFGKNAMAIVNTSDVSVVRKVTVSGSAVNALARRKEDNNHEKMTNEKLVKNLKKVKRAMFGELKKLASFSLAK